MNFVLPEWLVIVLGFMLVGSIARAIGGGGGGQRRLKNVKEMERRLEELEESQRQLGAGAGDTTALERRVGELEERLDFAERMLTKQRDGERLGPPPQA